MIDMTKMKAFVEVLVPGTQCNLKCHYCYLIQEGRRKMQKGFFPYSISVMASAFKPNRWGGALYISLCGEGETFLWSELPDFVLLLLRQGHYVNITTNGTLTNVFHRFYEIIPTNLHSHLNFSFSYHPLELNRLNRKEVFFSNIIETRNEGFSILVQVNLNDEYLPIIEEIKRDCIDKLGAMPQLAATRRLLSNGKWELFTKGSKDDYLRYGRSFNSPLFDFTMKNFMVKRREFCYAGKYSFSLSLRNGLLKPCYDSPYSQNIFDNPDDPIKLKAVGKFCRSPYCINSSHFMALGVIPSLKCPTYSELRNRICLDGSRWYTKDFASFVSQKLYDNNASISYLDLVKINVTEIKHKLFSSIYSFLYKILHNKS